MPEVHPDKILTALIVIFFVVEWIGRADLHALETLALRWRRAFRWGLYLAIALTILWFGGREQEFIYFQF